MKAVICGSALTGLLLLTACGTTSDEVSSGPTDEATAEPTATAIPSTPAPTPEASHPPASPDPIATPTLTPLPVPAFATVNAERLLIRRDPGLGGEPVIDASTCIHNPNPCERPFLLGTERGFLSVYLLDGPVVADGYDWYLAATEMNTEQHASTYPEAIGWVAAGDGTDAWLVPDERACPNQPFELADVTNLAFTKLEMLHCIGNQPLTLRGWYTSLPPGEEEPTSILEECRADRHWLLCGSIFDTLRPERRGWAGDAHYLDFVVDPASAVVLPERGQWITVTGTFDHPESDACGNIGQVVVCRTQFVITSAEPG